jgi:hypothetical protein
MGEVSRRTYIKVAAAAICSNGVQEKIVLYAS